MKINSELRKLWFGLILFSVVFGLTGCVTAEQKLLDSGMKPQTDQELRELFSKPFEGSFVNSKGNVFSVKFYPDGRQEVNGSRVNDTGSWRIVNGEQCSKWNTIRHGSERCTTWIKITKGKYGVFNSDGSKNGVMTVK
jgi:hypothetical protein